MPFYEYDIYHFHVKFFCVIVEQRKQRNRIFQKKSKIQNGN